MIQLYSICSFPFSRGVYGPYFLLLSHWFVRRSCTVGSDREANRSKSVNPNGGKIVEPSFKKLYVLCVCVYVCMGCVRWLQQAAYCEDTLVKNEKCNKQENKKSMLNKKETGTRKGDIFQKVCAFRLYLLLFTSHTILCTKSRRRLWLRLLANAGSLDILFAIPFLLSPFVALARPCRLWVRVYIGLLLDLGFVTQPEIVGHNPVAPWLRPLNEILLFNSNSVQSSYYCCCYNKERHAHCKDRHRRTCKWRAELTDILLLATNSTRGFTGASSSN